jgi:predicted transcriptional regulator
MLITGKLLRDMRKEAGLSQAQLAKLAKVSQAHIAKIETERVDPRLSTVNRITRILQNKERRKRCRSVMNPSIITTGPETPVEEAIRIMHKFDISQLPVMAGSDHIGSVDEATIIRNMSRRIKVLQVRDIMDGPFPIVDARDPVEIAQPLLDFHSAVLVADKGKLKGLIAKSDLLGMK